nr:unnamed protein product [Callosobruchus analis]
MEAWATVALASATNKWDGGEDTAEIARYFLLVNVDNDQYNCTYRIINYSNKLG